MRHLKSRNGECRDLRLAFDKPLQRFTPVDDSFAAYGSQSRKLQTALASMWNGTPAAPDDDWGAN